MTIYNHTVYPLVVTVSVMDPYNRARASILYEDTVWARKTVDYSDMPSNVQLEPDGRNRVERFINSAKKFMQLELPKLELAFEYLTTGAPPCYRLVIEEADNKPIKGKYYLNSDRPPLFDAEFLEFSEEIHAFNVDEDDPYASLATGRKVAETYVVLNGEQRGVTEKL